jgi:hypothetical protein
MRLPARSVHAVFAWFALLAAPALAYGQVSLLSNIVEEKEAAKGEEYTGRLILSNPTTAPQTVRIFQTDYKFNADGLTDYGDPSSMPRSNAAWLTIQSQRVVVPARSEITVPYTVKVPTSDSLKGTYWSAIMVEGAESAPPANTGRGGQVGIGSIVRYAVQVATHIGTSGTRGIKFEKPTATKSDRGAAGLTVDVISSGDRAVRPKLSVELYDSQGVLRGKAKQDRGLLYPGTSLRQVFDFGTIAPGTYKAVVFADTGDEKVLATQFTITY